MRQGGKIGGTPAFAFADLSDKNRRPLNTHNLADISMGCPLVFPETRFRDFDQRDKHPKLL